MNFYILTTKISCDDNIEYNIEIVQNVQFLNLQKEHKLLNNILLLSKTNKLLKTRKYTIVSLTHFH